MPKTCLTCGSDISHRTASSKRCEPCAKERGVLLKRKNSAEHYARHMGDPELYEKYIQRKQESRVRAMQDPEYRESFLRRRRESKARAMQDPEYREKYLDEKRKHSAKYYAEHMQDPEYCERYRENKRQYHTANRERLAENRYLNDRKRKTRQLWGEALMNDGWD